MYDRESLVVNVYFLKKCFLQQAKASWIIPLILKKLLMHKARKCFDHPKKAIQSQTLSKI